MNAIMDSARSLLCLLCALALHRAVAAQSPSPSPSPTPSVTPPDDGPFDNLSLIIGIPVGVGLALIGIGVCLLWLTCSAYCENKDNPKTASSNMGVSGNRSGTAHPAHSYNSSSVGDDSRAFQPSKPRTANPHKTVNQEKAQHDSTLQAETTFHGEDGVDHPEGPPTDSTPAEPAEAKDGGSTFDITYRSSITETQNEFHVTMQT